MDGVRRTLVRFLLNDSTSSHLTARAHSEEIEAAGIKLRPTNIEKDVVATARKVAVEPG